MRREESKIIGAGGNELFVRKWSPEQCEAKAIVCVVHGMGEHGDRYVHVAKRMSAEGFALMAMDQQGHGRSSGKRGHLQSIDAAASDTALMIDAAAKEHPGLPVFLYGHSMGGNVALNCALRFKPPISGLILTSPWLKLAFKPNPTVEWMGRMLAPIVPTMQVSAGLNGTDLYRDGFEDAAPIDALCHSKITLRTYIEVSTGGIWALNHAKELHVPLLLVHGTTDKITSMSASRQLADSLGGQCDWRAWEGGYHELHNDVDGEKFIFNIIEWMKGQL